MKKKQELIQGMEEDKREELEELLESPLDELGDDVEAVTVSNLGLTLYYRCLSGRLAPGVLTLASLGNSR